MANKYGWITFYEELADELLPYRKSRQELIQKIRRVYMNVKISLPKLESDNDPKDIDPFTIFGLFNKGISNANRIIIIKGMATEFGVNATIPDSFDGIPVLNNQNATFYAFGENRGKRDIDNLWDLFAAALEYAGDESDSKNRQKFIQAYELVRVQHGIRWNITIGLYWVRPKKYLSLDSRNRWYMSKPENISANVAASVSALDKKDEVPSAGKYLDLRDKCRDTLASGKYPYKSFSELSYHAWISSEEANKKEKDEKETIDDKAEETVQEELVQQFNGYRNPFSQMLVESKNLIFRGAPGTGKSYLAREIAADIVSNGSCNSYSLLTDEQKKQVEFVQFHPNYDYSDFVEGLRPKVNDDGTMGFELQDGIFKKFVARARKNYEDSRKSKETIKRESSVQESMSEFFSGLELGVDTFKTINGNEFTVTGVDDSHVYLSIPGNAQINKLTLNIDEIRRMLESDVKFEKIKDLTTFFGKTFATQAYSYDFALYKEILKRTKKSSKVPVRVEELKKYIFIIDEINRGEISKIFGELFFAIDPGYRGTAGEVSTQYANLHPDPDEKFYIPENVYIIGTMNDIDRSVDSFDFAMRRRFRFVELKADDRLEMLSDLGNEELEKEAIRRMGALNKEIANAEDLNENYQIGASYFLKLKTLTFDQLWTDYLRPLLQEYVQGMHDESELMSRFAKAYGYYESVGDTENEDSQNQG